MGYLAKPKHAKTKRRQGTQRTTDQANPGPCTQNTVHPLYRKIEQKSTNHHILAAKQ